MKNRFAMGLIAGVLCSALVFTGVYCIVLRDKGSAGNRPNAYEATDTPGAEQPEKPGKTENTGGTTATVKPTEAPKAAKLMDDKAQYILNLTNKYFLYEVDEEAYKTAIYRALMDACDDPYSCYYTPDEYKSMMESTDGSYCGIGCLVSQDVKTKLITIVRPFKDSPAEKVGIQAGDIVYKVNGEDVSGQDINFVVSKMKGAENTTVDMTMYRDGQYLDFTLTRAFIEIETVTVEKIKQAGKKIGLITITEFDEVTQKQFLKALEELKAWEADAMVIDLRDNPGGRLDVVVAMLDPLLPEGLTVYMKDKNGAREEFKSDANYYGIPTAVVINANSASASEIFAGAVQDYSVATIVGKQSFGKGIVQSVIPMMDGSAVKLTIADYYTPLGRNIHGIGIAPDIEVDMPEGKTPANTERENDTQLQAAFTAVLEQLK